MSALSIQPTYPIFTDIDGQPLEDGFVWIGQANLDPQVNPINIFWDAALTIPAGQPIRTLGGYPSNSGTPARLYVNSDYSIRVMNKNGSVVYSAPAATERYSEAVVNTNAANVVYDPAGTGAVATTVQAKLRETVSVLDFGADPTGVADSTTAIQDAINAVVASGGVVYFPAGTYNYTPNATFNITISGDGLTLKGDIGRSFIKTDFNGLAFNVVTNFRASINFLGSDGLNIEGLYFENQNYNTTNTNATCFYVTRGIEYGALCNISDCTFGRYTNCAVHGIRAWH